MVRSVIIKAVPASEVDALIETGWTQVSHAIHGRVRVRKDLKKWERFEASTRQFFCDAGFESVPPWDDFHYTELGPQVDVCGGVESHFIVMDCTSKEEPG